MKIKICIRATQKFRLQAQHIAGKYQFPLVEDFSNSGFKYGLDYQEDGLKLIDLHNRKYRPIFVAIQKTHPLAKKNTLGRAIGRKSRFVVDATAGMGGDAILMARMGIEVLAIERSPVISAILEDGIHRLSKGSPSLKIRHRYGDANVILPTLQRNPDAIYLDPMFPEGRKTSVKVARPLRVMREFAGDDLDSNQLFKSALKTSPKRIVVKRPKFAKSLYPELLSTSQMGKLVRYDVYLINCSD